MSISIARKTGHEKPNTNVFVPQHSVYLNTHVITGGIRNSPDDTIQTKHLSIPNTGKSLDNSVNIDGES